MFIACMHHHGIELQDRTRFGPNRPAADMEGNGEYDFWVIYEEFGRIAEYFWRNEFLEIMNFRPSRPSLKLKESKREKRREGEGEGGRLECVIVAAS